MCRRLGMERIELTDADIAHIDVPRRLRGGTLLRRAADRRSATRCEAHVIDERGLRRDRRRAAHVSEAVVRKRVSRGLATARRRMGRQG